jgi:hypothetical protein
MKLSAKNNVILIKNNVKAKHSLGDKDTWVRELSNIYRSIKSLFSV